MLKRVMAKLRQRLHQREVVEKMVMVALIRLVVMGINE